MAPPQPQNPTQGAIQALTAFLALPTGQTSGQLPAQPLTQAAPIQPPVSQISTGQTTIQLHAQVPAQPPAQPPTVQPQVQHPAAQPPAPQIPGPGPGQSQPGQVAAQAPAQALTPEEQIEQFPWKYVGYRDFSRWVASDQAWFITRRFSTLNARVILRLQNNVVRLEEKLNTLDWQYSRGSDVMKDDDQTHNGSFRLDSFQDRITVMEDLTVALREYNSFVNEYAQLASRPVVRPSDIEAVRTWLGNYEDAIHDEEAAYITDDIHEDDLIPVHPKNRSWFRKVLEKTPFLRHKPLRLWLSRKPCDPLISERNQDTIWHNDIRVERLSGGVIGLVGLVMLIGPIWALDKVGPNDIRLGIISGFIIVFYILVGIATTAKIFESLAAVAAYSAVLMVFMQIAH